MAYVIPAGLLRISLVFKNTCVPNSPDKHCALKDEFYHNWFNYKCDLSKEFHVDVEMIDRCINKLKRGKAAGMDGLNVEHLIWCLLIQSLFRS